MDFSSVCLSHFEEETVPVSVKDVYDKLTVAAANRGRRHLEGIRATQKAIQNNGISPDETRDRAAKFLRTHVLQEKVDRLAKRLIKRDQEEMDGQEELAQGEAPPTLADEDAPDELSIAAIETFEEAVEEASPDVLLATDNGKVGLEALIGRNDILSIETLEEGLIAARAIGRIELMGGATHGTGFLVGQGLLLTNHHVLGTEALASAGTITFNYEDQRLGSRTEQQTFFLRPERFWLSDEAYDFTLVALTEVSDRNVRIEDFGWHPLLEEGKILAGHAVNIIQHPAGSLKSIVMHNSHFLYLDNTTVDERYCWYSGDTKDGSSGSPVFSRDWQIVALHHKAVPRTDAEGHLLDKNGRKISQERYDANPEVVAHIANEGIRASRLRRRIREATFKTPAQAALRDDLIALWDNPLSRSVRWRFQTE